MRKKLTKKAATQIFSDFATGAISTEDFWERYKSDEALRNVLIKDKKRNKFQKIELETGVVYRRYDDAKDAINPDNLLETVNIDKLEHRYRLFTVINRYLISRKIKLNNAELNDDVKEYLFLYELLPDWTSVEDISFLQNLMSLAPSDMTKTQKTAWCKAKIKELFKFDEKKPKWIQQPEWPFINGQPLIFSHQETTEDGLEKFHFYDKDTNKETIVEQCE